MNKYIMFRTKIRKGCYLVGSTRIIFRKAPSSKGHNRLANTWRDERTDELLGYTLKEAAELAWRRYVQGQEKFRAEGRE